MRINCAGPQAQDGEVVFEIGHIRHLGNGGKRTERRPIVALDPS